MCGNTHAIVCMLKSEDNLWKSVFFLHHMYPGNKIKVIWLGSRCLYLQSPLAGPGVTFKGEDHVLGSRGLELQECSPHTQSLLSSPRVGPRPCACYIVPCPTCEYIVYCLVSRLLVENCPLALELIPQLC